MLERSDRPSIMIWYHFSAQDIERTSGTHAHDAHAVVCLPAGVTGAAENPGNSSTQRLSHVHADLDQMHTTLCLCVFACLQV